MSTKEIEFDPNELLRRMESLVEGQAKTKVYTITIPEKADTFPAEKIKKIREGLNLSQAAFAALLNVPRVTAIKWEHGTRSPSGAAIRLLQIAERNPAALCDLAAPAARPRAKKQVA